MIAYYRCTKCDTYENVPVENLKSVPRCWICGSTEHVAVLAYGLQSR